MVVIRESTAEVPEGAEMVFVVRESTAGVADGAEIMQYVDWLLIAHSPSTSTIPKVRSLLLLNRGLFGCACLADHFEVKK